MRREILPPSPPSTPSLTENFAKGARLQRSEKLIPSDENLAFDFMDPPFQFRDDSSRKIWHMHAASMDPATLEMMHDAARFAEKIEKSSRPGLAIMSHLHDKCLIDNEGPTALCNSLFILTRCWQEGETLEKYMAGRMRIDRQNIEMQRQKQPPVTAFQYRN